MDIRLPDYAYKRGVGPNCSDLCGVASGRRRYSNCTVVRAVQETLEIRLRVPVAAVVVLVV
jgi:hypothetical protein